MRVWQRSWIGAAALASMAGDADAASLPRYGTFLYSSLCVERQSGDAAGFRITLQRSTKEDSLSFEWSEGPLFGPMRASNLTIDPKTLRIAFTIPAHTPPSDIPISESYSGVISDQAVTLQQSGYGDKRNLTPYRPAIVIPRVKDAGREDAPCKTR